MVPVLEQFQSFFFTILIGFLIGIIVDGYRTLCDRLPLVRTARTVTDIIIWLFLTGLVFFLLLLNNWGEVRAYVLIGMAIGAIIYRQKFSTYVVRWWRLVFLMAGKLILIILFPFRLMQKILFVPLGLVSMLLDWCWRILKGVLRRLGIRPHNWRRILARLRRKPK